MAVFWQHLVSWEMVVVTELSVQEGCTHPSCTASSHSRELVTWRQGCVLWEQSNTVTTSSPKR